MHPERASNMLTRFLNLFTEVHRGEGGPALLLALNIFMILSAYYVLKPVREALILAGGGAEIKSYAAAGQAILLLGAVPGYAWLASRVSRRMLINGVTLFFTGCLLIFYGLAQLEVPLGIAFFLWVGVFNLMVPAQFWALANDIYTREAGERLFVIVAFGASCGAIAGSYLDAMLLEVFGVYQLMLVAAAILASSLVLTNWIERRDQLRQSAASEPAARGSDEDEPLSPGGAFELVFRSRYLLLIALLMLVLNWVNTTGEYILGRTVLAAAERATEAASSGIRSTESFIGSFYAKFYTVVNLAGLFLQLFVVSRVLKFLGVRVAVTILPMIALGGYLVAAFFPLLTMVRWAKTAENATDYSLQNTVRQVLFLPTTREQKYKAKQAIDTFFVRAGDVLSAAVVFVGTTWLACGTQAFALFNVGLALVWLVLAFMVGREYARLSDGPDQDETAS